jgi:O-methyltransferase involved in polyketide biosynthesis
MLRRSGYYARVAAIRQLVLQFLAAGGAPGQPPPPKQARWVAAACRARTTLALRFSRRAAPHAPQIVSLGAGFDTTAFNLAAAGVAPARYIEVDFAEARDALALSRMHACFLAAAC